MSPAERGHSEGHPTTRQRQRTNSKALAQTNDGDHQSTNDKADERSSQLRLLHPVEGQDIGTATNCRAERHGEAP